MSVHQLVPLPVVIPLLTAALIVMTGFAPKRFHDVVATTAAAGNTALCAVLLTHARHGPVVEWLGGWRPHHGVALGIALTADQLGAGAALLASAVLTAALVYSWVYFEDAHGFVLALMLVLTAGIAGMCLTGDLFTMVVFFVLTTVSAIGLTAVENEHRGPLQGAINFAVVNSVAGFALLLGSALVYGRTGALNLAQIALTLDHHPADALVAVAFAALVLGLLTKAGAAPFHFWPADAYAVAPTPVCTLFAGAMVTASLLAVARLLATAFAPPLQAHQAGVRAVLVGIGVATAAIAAVACFQQRHVKRLLAFASVSQVGTMLCGVGLLRSQAVAGAAASAAGIALTIAALFGAAGVLIRRYGTIDEFDLAGRARDLPITGCTFVLGALALASLPPTAVFAGRGLIEDGARAAGMDWLPVVLAATSAIVAGSVLRVTGRVFLDWGVREQHDPRVASEERSQEATAAEEADDQRDGERPPVVLALTPLALMVAVVALGCIPGFVPSLEAAAAHFRDTGAYLGAVLQARAPHYAPVATPGLGATAWIYAGLSVAGAVAIGWAGLRGRRLFPEPLIDAMRAAHSGHVGDYVAWWTFGMAVLGGLLLWVVAG